MEIVSAHERDKTENRSASGARRAAGDAALEGACLEHPKNKTLMVVRGKVRAIC